MEAYQQRVVDEQKELHDRRAKLGVFIRSEKFNGLPKVEQELLTRQLGAMVEYEGILDDRIDLFPKVAPAAKPAEPKK